MRKLYSVMGNSQRLDGGAMFGNVPKVMWEKWLPANENNQIQLACRALLVQEEGRNILFESGIGAFFEPKLKQRFGVIENEHVLLISLENLGLSHEDIDVIVLSHLHFDHAGGLLSKWQEGKESTLLFPNAQFIIGQEAWLRAKNPHPRDRASFIPQLNSLLEASGRVVLQGTEYCDILGQDFSFHISNGHTPGMMLSEIATDEGPIAFVADLIPGSAWVHLPVTMGYDRFPEALIDEKRQFLEHIVEKNGRLFYTHDPKYAASRVEKDERGRFIAINKIEDLS